MAGSKAKSTKDILTQLANVLPTSTYLTFQLIAPLATNNGHCGTTEKIATDFLLGVFAAIIAISSFTDSVKIPSTGTVYYGLVTTKGLWSPAFQGAKILGVTGAFYTAGGSKYTVRLFDFVSAAFSLTAFAALSLLTDPVTSCYVKGLSSTVTKTVPLIVAVVISFVLILAPAARNGFGSKISTPPQHSLHTSPTKSMLLHEQTLSTAKPCGNRFRADRRRGNQMYFSSFG